ncbi:MAG: formate dehydrogenase accessory sulfurtransferase FdhD [Syntrophales bacterium]
MESFEVTFVGSDERCLREVGVTREVPLTLEVNGKEMATLLCSPTDSENLVIGFLYNAGVITALSAVESLVIDRELWKASVGIKPETLPGEFVFKRIYTSGCGKGIIFHNPLDLLQRGRLDADFTVKGESVLKLMKKFLNFSDEHKFTRGVHSAALAAGEEMLVFRDDLGRHNAVDKVIGQAISQGIGFEDKWLLASGRISSEITSKMLRCRIPLVVSSGAPTDQAVRIALDTGLGMATLARGGGINVYSCPERVN